MSVLAAALTAIASPTAGGSAKSGSAGYGYRASQSRTAQIERAWSGRVGSAPGDHITTRPPARRQSQASDAARRAIWSAASEEGGAGSQNRPSVCTPGGSNSRTISWPCRALERQWMRRRGSPGRYSRAPNISFPEPARGAAMLASSSLTFCRSANALNRGKTATNSKSTFGPRRRKNPSGSPLSVVHPLAATGPRRSGPSSRNSVQPSFGTRPAAADNSLPPTDPKMRPGPRVPCFDSISSATFIRSPSNTGTSGPAARICTGSSSIGEP